MNIFAFTEKYLGKKTVEKIIFNIKWFLIPFYLKLGWCLIHLLYLFIFEKVQTLDTMEALESIDIVMIANLIKMIISGSYNSFVSKTHGYKNENISSGALKLKMGTSLIGVSSIYLLALFFNDNVKLEMLYKPIALHATFLIGALLMAIINFFHEKAEYYSMLIEIEEEKNEIDEHENKDK